MASDVESSYTNRAAEYIGLLGSMAAVHPADEHLVTSWAHGIDGPLLDAGCGPGHWTAHLAGAGCDVRGIDQVPEFIAHARAAHPSTTFHLGSMDALPDAAGGLAGVLAWYSLVHHGPGAIHRPLGEFARTLRPGGGLLVGFFVGPHVEPFEHAVVTAYRWTPGALSGELRSAGFDVLETHTRTSPADGPRPHGAMVAQRRDDAPSFT
ncbi:MULTISPECIES: class I SAM-dependent methyltransferase [unclassified Curtobacterium]|uniref:class I SAM-dependent methyltransferase n=1 Tax=unclassified Curtobacterium TaxID=257496 RepID=UPI00380AF0B7